MTPAQGWGARIVGLCRLGLLGGVLLVLAACQRTDPDVQLPAYGERPAPGSKLLWTLAVHPLHNPVTLHERYGPLLEWANARLADVELRLEASSDYAHFEAKLRMRQPELALPNPYQTVRALPWGYHVVGKVSGDEDFHGLVLRRRGWQLPPPGSVIRISCPALTALAGCMLPRWQLHRDGLDRTHRLKIEVVGSQESSILNVAHGLVDLALTWPPPWRLFQQREPKLAATLEVDRRTPALVNNALVARDDLDPQRVAQVVQALVDLARDPEGQRRLAQAGLQGFERANDARYEPVRVFLREYERVFGSLP
ncbi:MAG: PhnD/SsuA/transferrin family substrate-binding protein [Tepidimonas sp.]|uniref:phosphate/phosphite/phosphonate ABC transporter substrate-binding protein n=1 Tax=Tepidimonas sp. TaxID=2002775 RepID=UPI00298F180F|nr:PhnD/SsuA/transferrin family substrate-binding protein [Tepidimonas sp.]MCS6810249.1 PhnD/SsuA/transferrin family substrate-binding protein [Tepidimonas sp.]MDW8336628.1 PhnD/SsuA/transferrin family substrate-binding protein [Tepidimonas sp.]